MSFFGVSLSEIQRLLYWYHKAMELQKAITNGFTSVIDPISKLGYVPAVTYGIVEVARNFALYGAQRIGGGMWVRGIIEMLVKGYFEMASDVAGIKSGVLAAQSDAAKTLLA